jgi:beta-galactosidase
MRYLYTLFFALLFSVTANAQNVRITQNFNQGWKFFLGDAPQAKDAAYNDATWRKLNLPHDWSIEGSFSEKNPTTFNGGALPAGIGWYRKTFTLPVSYKGKNVFIDFDGVYRYSEVWINGHYLGLRPNGYISFRYDITPYIKTGAQKNVVVVKADNSAQPNSRWYTGSGIYRNVWLVATAKTYIPKWGVFVTTPKVSADAADISVNTTIKPSGNKKLNVQVQVFNAKGKVVVTQVKPVSNINDTSLLVAQTLTVNKPVLWSTSNPYLYKVVIKVLENGKVVDDKSISTGIRYFNFDADKGFSLNGKNMKILGVCMHHDLGALGAAINNRAIQRQLEILKAMGCNAIRCSHNPPAPELLDLCDKMGFLVMDEAFDMWRKKKNKQDYFKDFDKWHVRDLQDQVLRDRNHPSVFVWSIGNEIREQFDSTGVTIGRELVGIVKQLDKTRPVTCALSDPDPKKNFIYQSGALDLIGLNYHPEVYADFKKNFPGEAFIGTENMSALATRGHYDMPSDSVRRWPKDGKTKLTDGNSDLTVSAYDNVSAYWGSTHEETWKIIKKYDHLSGLFVWTGFDYLGEPVPYEWPARSSYYGIVDLAGFPKDAYYMYQSEWTDKPMLHLFPHWNWQPGKTVDVWAYYNQADEVELFLNDKSLGVKTRKDDEMHVQWRVKFEPGIIKVVSRKQGKVILTKEIHTAGKPAKLQLVADRSRIKADGTDLSYITVKVLDAHGNMVPDAGNLVNFKLTGPATIAGVDNGLQTSMESFKANHRKAFNGMCLAIVQAKTIAGKVTLQATSAGLKPASITITTAK